jgi:hypothetical protein
LGNARAWAIDKSDILGTPTVLRYTIDDAILGDTKLKILRFDKTTVDWLNFVRDNRRRIAPDTNPREPRHYYDVVSGPIANDKVAIAVDKYCRGILTVEETLMEVRTIREVFQMSLHTPLALTFIQSTSVSQLRNKRWTPFI